MIDRRADARILNMKALFRHRVVAVSLALGLLLYGLLWGLTAVWGVRDLRAYYEAFPMGYFPADPDDPDAKPVTLVRAERFDPVRFSHPGKERTLLYFGELRSPAPFLISLEIAMATEEGGHASQLLIHWWPGDWKLVDEKTFWSFGNYSEPIY